MPIALYSLPLGIFALIIVGGIVVLSLAGLWLARRYLLPRLTFHDGVNDAVSGTVQAIGVFYGVTVGLIAVGVWNNYSNALDVTSHEAAGIAALYRDVSALPEPTRSELRVLLKDYTRAVVTKVWPAQQSGDSVKDDVVILSRFEDVLDAFEPATDGQKLRYAEALDEYNSFYERHRLRIDELNSGLSPVMWVVIFIGAAISIGVAYLFNIEDAKLHALLILLVAGFLGIVLFMIAINDKPFTGGFSVGPDSYQLVLDSLD